MESDQSSKSKCNEVSTSAHPEPGKQRLTRMIAIFFNQVKPVVVCFHIPLLLLKICFSRMRTSVTASPMKCIGNDCFWYMERKAVSRRSKILAAAQRKVYQTRC